MNGLDKLKEYIKEEEQALPKELQSIIDTYEWANIAEKIGKDHKLIDEEILSLQIETALVLLGITRQNAYTENLEENIIISEQEANKVSGEVNQKIFIPTYSNLAEKIKQGMKDKDPTWKQNVNFVLSDGDYTAFINTPGTSEEKIEDIESPQFPTKSRGVPTSKNSPSSDIDTSFISKKIGEKDDLRSKFRI